MPYSDVAQRASAQIGVPATLLGDFVETLAQVVLQQVPQHQDWSRYRSQGDRAVAKGIAADTVRGLYMNAARLTWSALADVLAGKGMDLAAAGARLLDTLTSAISALEHGYEQALHLAALRQQDLRQAFVRDLLNGNGCPDQLSVQSRHLGFRLAETHLVALCDAPDDHHDAHPAVYAVRHRLGAVLGDDHVLVTVTGHQLVVIAAAPCPPDTIQQITQALAPIPHRYLALGRAHRSAAGIAASYAEARDAHHYASALAVTSPVVHVEEFLVHRVLARDRDALTDLVDSTLQPLRAERGGQALIDTLTTFLNTGGNTTATARALDIGARTVTHRLDRIARITGLDTTNPVQRYALHTAILGQQLLRAPNGPPS